MAQPRVPAHLARQCEVPGGEPEAAPRAPGRSRAGFTLIELLVVITVIAILSVMIVPQFASTYQDSLLRAAGRELLAVMNLAWSQAVSLQRTHRLRIDPGQNRYWLESLQETGRGAMEFAPVRDVPGSAGQIDRRITLEAREPGESIPRERDAAAAPPEGSGAAPEVILFLPDGTAEARQVLLSDPEGFRISLEVQPSTARVRLRSLGREEKR